MSIRTALVSGANRGLGLEMCRQLSELSSTEAVIATTRSVQKSTDLNQLSAKNRKIHVLEFDVTDYKRLPKFLDDCHVIVRNRGLNLLINNAGIVSREPLTAITAKSLSDNFEVNAMAPLLLTQKLLPLLKTSANNGDPTSVVNISSTLGSFATNIKAKSYYPYSISKAALNMITKLLASDLKEHRIRSLAIHPGWVKTDMGTKDALLDIPFAVTSIMKVLVNIDDSLNGKLINYDSKVLQF